MMTDKKLYLLITRGLLLGFMDSDGGGARLSRDAPAIEAALKALPDTCKVSLGRAPVPFTRRATGAPPAIAPIGAATAAARSASLDCSPQRRGG
jgi:hypothetical protein